MLRTAVVCSALCALALAYPTHLPRTTSDEGLTVGFGVTVSPKGPIDLGPSIHPEESTELDQSIDLYSTDLDLTSVQEVPIGLYQENTEVFEFPSDLESVTFSIVEEAFED